MVRRGYAFRLSWDRLGILSFCKHWEACRPVKVKLCGFCEWALLANAAFQWTDLKLPLYCTSYVKELVAAARQVWAEFLGRPRNTKKARVHRGKKQGHRKGTFSSILQQRRLQAFSSADRHATSKSMLESAGAAKRNAGGMWSEKMDKELAFNAQKRQKNFHDALSAGHLVESEYTAEDATRAQEERAKQIKAQENTTRKHPRM